MPTPSSKLAGFQRRYLRGLANPRKALVQIGEGGLSEGVLSAVESALDDHELVKIRLREPEDKKATAQELAEKTGAELCGVVGHTVILFRPRKESPQIELPQRAEA